MKVPEGVEILIEGLDEEDISSILLKWKEINIVKKKLEKVDEMLRTKIKIFLKEREWTKYNDKKTSISISLLTQKRTIPDMQQLKITLTPAQFSQVVRTTTFEKLSILTLKDKERLKKFCK